ncbi:MAG: SDR family oxidoreductase [Hyphomicrobiales bacterium]|nr:SDR family oxidoreductase [Hyphomicrobiales bacterium]MCP5370650.1 SDR family oxidoreductase [Hyphomicrobiales bacterium]
MRLQDKVAVVTGAAQGIGRACAQRFAAEGARVVLADMDADKGARADAAIRAAGGEALFVQCDVGDKTQVDELIRLAVDAYGRLDIMLSNAGVLHTCDFLDIAEEDFDRVVRVNLKGVFLTGQAAARRMVAQGGGGAIINMSSVNAVMAIPTIAPYVACKGGVNQLTKVMAVALADRGIRVNAIGPGTISTDMGMTMMADPESRRRVLSRTPLGRAGAPDEIASVAVFLASDESSYITGQTIYPDGGRLALNYTVPVAD